MTRPSSLLTRVVSRALGAVASVSSLSGVGAEVVITFDDGPDGVHTPLILEALRDRKVHATFFLLGTRVHPLRSLVEEVAAAGHQIASHGLDHRRASGFDFAEHRDRLRRARQDLEDVVGIEVRYVRPPYGLLTPSWCRAARSQALETVLWSRESGDALHVAHARRVALALDGVRAGDILLAHDGYAGPADGADDGDPPLLDRAGLIGEVLDRYRAVGLRGCSLHEARLRSASG